MAWCRGGTQAASWPAVCLVFKGLVSCGSLCEETNGAPNLQEIGRGVQAGEP